MLQSHPEWTFHLVGKDFGDDYAAQIKKMILDYKLQDRVFVYGSKQDVVNILNQSDIAVLTSQSEGLPVALLEYGWSKKPVIVTNVGEIPLLIQEGINGFMVETGNAQLFYESLVKLADNEILRNNFGRALHETINSSYSEKAVLEHYLKWLDKKKG